MQKEPTHQPDNLKLLICHCIGCSEVPWVQEGVWMQVSPRGMSSAVPVQTERRDRVYSSFKNVAPQSLWEQIIFQKSKSTFNISNTCMIFVSGFFFIYLFFTCIEHLKIEVNLKHMLAWLQCEWSSSCEHRHANLGESSPHGPKTGKPQCPACTQDWFVSCWVCCWEMNLKWCRCNEWSRATGEIKPLIQEDTERSWSL